MGEPEYNTTYNGYYYKGEYDEENDKLENILYNVKNNVDAAVGDYLLLAVTENSDIISIILKKLTEIENNVYTFIEITPGDEYIYYSALSNIDSPNIIYYININTKIISQASNYQNGKFNNNDNILYGIINNNMGVLYDNIIMLLKLNSSETTILSLNYNDLNTFMPVITGLSQFKFIDRYYVYQVSINLKNTDAIIEMIPNNKYTFNGYYSGNDITTNKYYDILKTIKNNLNPLLNPIVGDYLLLRRSTDEFINPQNTTIYLLKYTTQDLNIQDPDDNKFTEKILNNN